jgi:hypothetical protein
MVNIDINENILLEKNMEYKMSINTTNITNDIITYSICNGSPIFNIYSDIENNTSLISYPIIEKGNNYSTISSSYINILDEINISHIKLKLYIKQLIYNSDNYGFSINIDMPDDQGGYNIYKSNKIQIQSNIIDKQKWFIFKLPKDHHWKTFRKSL